MIQERAHLALWGITGGSCVRKCGPGFYGDQEMGECEPCHQECETCTGPGHDECSSCWEGLQPLRGVCVRTTQTREEGKFWNEAVPIANLSVVKSLLQERRRWKVQIKRAQLGSEGRCD
ncbi:hypothetical protein H8959_012095 [Pygathrix nigripes]